MPLNIPIISRNIHDKLYNILIEKWKATLQELVDNLAPTEANKRGLQLFEESKRKYEHTLQTLRNQKIFFPQKEKDFFIKFENKFLSFQQKDWYIATPLLLNLYDEWCKLYKNLLTMDMLDIMSIDDFIAVHKRRVNCHVRAVKNAWMPFSLAYQSLHYYLASLQKINTDGSLNEITLNYEHGLKEITKLHEETRQKERNTRGSLLSTLFTQQVELQIPREICEMIKKYDDATSAVNQIKEEKKLPPQANEIATLFNKYNMTELSFSQLEKALRTAAANNEVNDLKILINSNININARDPESEKTALHIAAEKNATECIRELLLNNADCLLSDAKRKIPLNYTTNPEIIGLFNQKNTPRTRI